MYCTPACVASSISSGVSNTTVLRVAPPEPLTVHVLASRPAQRLPEQPGRSGDQCGAETCGMVANYDKVREHNLTWTQTLIDHVDPQHLRSPALPGERG